MPTVLEWSVTVEPSEYVRQVRETLSAGRLVIVPGDAGYGVLLNPAGPHAAEQLDAITGMADMPPAVFAYGPDEATRFRVVVPITARRLMTRAWPAPLVLALDATIASLPANWPTSVQEKVTAGGRIRFRCPEHPLTDVIYPALSSTHDGVLTLIVETLRPTATEVADRLGEEVGLIVSAGEAPACDRPTVVVADAKGWQVTESGAFPAHEVQRLTARIVLFVCTGNTCRSPLAEGLAKKLLVEHLGCTVDELPEHGYWVLSAGVMAAGGSPAAPEAADVAAEFGADLLGHRSRPVNPQLLVAADEVVTMTRGHAHALAVRYPGVGPDARLLCADGTDLEDPIGSGLETYRACAQTILKHLGRIIPEWVGP